MFQVLIILQVVEVVEVTIMQQGEKVEVGRSAMT